MRDDEPFDPLDRAWRSVNRGHRWGGSVRLLIPGDCSVDIRASETSVEIAGFFHMCFRVYVCVGETEMMLRVTPREVLGPESKNDSCLAYRATLNLVVLIYLSIYSYHRLICF